MNSVFIIGTPFHTQFTILHQNMTFNLVIYLFLLEHHSIHKKLSEKIDNLQSYNKIYNVLASLIYVLSDISPIISIADIQIASLVDIWDLQI
jgi:hypothetical protein